MISRSHIFMREIHNEKNEHSFSENCQHLISYNVKCSQNTDLHSLVDVI